MKDIKTVLSTISTAFWSIVFLSIGLGIGVFCIWAGGKTLYQKWHWHEYLKTNAEVSKWYVSSSTHTGVAYGVAKTSTSWGIGCKYYYTIDGEGYSGYGQIKSAYNKEDAEKTVASHKTGDFIAVWYHPDTPFEPITENKIPKTGNSIWLIFFGAIVSLFLINISISVIKEKFSPNEFQDDEYTE